MVELCADVKRLHDFGKPSISRIDRFHPGAIRLIALCLFPGDPGPNRYGERTNAPAGTEGRRKYGRAPLPHARSALIIETAERLEKRVAERFPDAGLRGVATELVSLSRDLAKAAKALEAPIWWLRAS